jgi:hypothetical protein
MIHSSIILPVMLAAVTVALPANAASEAELDALYEAIGTPQMIEIMRVEGLDQAAELQASMFPGRGGWDAVASKIYDTGQIATKFRGKFDTELAEADIEPLLTFFASDLGSRIITLEISAREALLNEDVETTAQEAYATLSDDNPDRAALIERFVSTNDLVELNVMGALNASLAFYTGLSDGGGFNMSEDEMLREVWNQEPDVRIDTESWLYSYAAMAYQPLPDADLETYTELSETPAGRDLNRALFAGFDAVFNEISFSLGRAASQFVQGDDI